MDRVAELKVSLAGARPPIWRQVRLPVTATLGDLHVVIQLLFGWDGDHLHVFSVGKRQYSDPFVTLDGARDEDEVRVRDAMTAGAAKVSYTYDFGACWRQPRPSPHRNISDISQHQILDFRQFSNLT